MSQYDERFYEVIKEGCLRSARAVVPRILELVAPSTVIDFGCGEGWWLSVFKSYGCTVRGFDGNYVNRDRLAIDPTEFFAIDFEHDMVGVKDAGDRVDLAISLEVAEHLPERRAGVFVEQLCDAAPVVLFSAAIPGQGGTGHINEQWPNYWASKFGARGYAVTGALRFEFWDRAPVPVENWYAQNMLLCVDRRHLPERSSELISLFRGRTASALPLVHPVLWDSRR